MKAKLQTVVNVLVIVLVIQQIIVAAPGLEMPRITTLSADRQDSFEQENVSLVTHVGTTALVRIGETNSFLIVPNVYLNVGFADKVQRKWAAWFINGIPSECYGIRGRMSYAFPHDEENEGNYLMAYDIPPSTEPTGPCFTE